MSEDIEQPKLLGETATIKRKLNLLKKLEASLGVVTTACKMAKVDRSTHYIWKDEDAVYRELVDDLSNVALDYAESKLHKNIEKGKETSIIFYLKTKGKARGYVERFENMEVPAEQPLFPDQDDKQ